MIAEDCGHGHRASGSGLVVSVMVMVLSNPSSRPHKSIRPRLSKRLFV